MKTEYMVAGAVAVGAVLFIVLRRRPGAAVTIPVAPAVPAPGPELEPIVLPTLISETGDGEGLGDFLDNLREALKPPDLSSLLNPDPAPNFPDVANLAPSPPSQPVVIQTETDAPSWREIVMPAIVERAEAVAAIEAPSPLMAQVQAVVAQRIDAATAPGATNRDIMSASFATQLALGGRPSSEPEPEPVKPEPAKITAQSWMDQFTAASGG